MLSVIEHSFNEAMNQYYEQEYHVRKCFLKIY